MQGWAKVAFIIMNTKLQIPEGTFFCSVMPSQTYEILKNIKS